MLTSELNRHDLFVHPRGDGYLLYAPLTGFVVEATVDEVLHLEDQIRSGQIDAEWECLFNNPAIVAGMSSVEETPELTILLNQVCNFSCKYCYSAKGREGVVLDEARLFTVIDWFLAPSRGRDLSLVFSGGGDPVLSFDRLQAAVVRSQELASSRGIRLHIGLVTNGSTLSPSRVSFLQAHDVEVVISFDILKDVHNAQRSHYDQVACMLRMLSESGMDVGVRATITPLNVTRLSEMVTELHDCFPRVRRAAFEVVLSKDLFATAAELEDFYARFTDHIFPAIALGRTFGQSIGNTLINNVGSIKLRACSGKLVVTPYGELTACSRLSSPLEPHYETFRYGMITPSGQIQWDEKHYASLMSCNASAYPECHSCIAKFHCSGGCMLARESLPADYFAAYCRFNREMVARTLAVQNL